MNLKLRISITDKCNLNCKYCKPQFYYKKSLSELLSYEEIEEICKLFLKNLPLKIIRFTGGEPLLRKDFPSLLSSINKLKRVQNLRIGLTTNGTLLKDFAYELYKNGLDDLNVSLDTINEQKFKNLTGGNIKDVLEGLKKAKELKFPIKINCVLIKGINDDEIQDLITWSWEMNFFIRFIEFMPFNSMIKWSENTFIGKEEILNKLLKFGKFKRYPSKSTAQIFLREDGKGFGIIPSVSEPFCSDCNRLRITADGHLKPCLKSKNTLYVKPLLLSNAGKQYLLNEINKILLEKKLNPNAIFENDIKMFSIGG